MANLLPILRNRRRRQAAARRSPLVPLAWTMTFIFSAAIAIAVIGAALGLFVVNRDVPPLETLPRLIEPPYGLIYHPTEIFDRSGKNLLIRLENPAAKDKQYLLFDDEKSEHLPPILGEAAVATTDADFWTHPGVTRLSLTSPRPLTIAERLVDQFLLADQPPGLLKTIRQKWLALLITGRYGRQRILEWYLNSANYGRLAYGADAAARVYLGKPASRLNLAEIALLAALTQAPALNPIDSPDAAIERQQGIIHLLREKGIITPSESETALETRMSFQEPLDWPYSHAAVFTQYAIRQLVDLMGWERLERGGMDIITTLDVAIQSQAACLTQTHLNHMKGTGAGAVREVNTCEAARLLPTLPSSSDVNSAQDLAADLAVLDVRTGQILALHAQHPPVWESSIQEGRPAGSLLTPLVYLAGFTRGYTPATLVWDVPQSNPASPIPHYEKTYDGPLRLRNALANDILAPAAEIFSQIGSEEISRHFQQLGITPSEMENDHPEKIIWEGGRFRLIELLHAYAAIANQGFLAGQYFAGPGEYRNTQYPAPLKPNAILSVTDIDNQVWLDWSAPQTKAVLSPELAYLVTNILGDEPARWKSFGHPNPLEIDRPAGVKIGRTNSGEDAWTIGYTPGLAAAVWIGVQEGQEKLPAMAAAPLWNAIMRYANQDAPVTWMPPQGVHAVQVCDPSGMLPTTHCPNIVREVFLRGTEPAQKDTLFYPVQVDVETGRLATTYTDLDAIDDKTYMRFPDKASSWAIQAGLSFPPAVYDTLVFPGSQAADVRIERPDRYDYVRGLVEISGTAAIDDFASYHIKAGRGLNPSEWLNIGEPGRTPIRAGKLAEWDTRGLNGTYVLELMVEDGQKRITTSSQLVTVDNKPPIMDIEYPSQGQVIEISTGEDLVFQVSAADEIGIASLSFSIGEREIRTIRQPPYVCPWRGKPGSYTLAVQATDLAGNIREKRITFVILTVR